MSLLPKNIEPALLERSHTTNEQQLSQQANMLASLLSLSPIAPIAFLAGVYATYVVLAAVFDPLRSVPGLFLARFTRLWYFYAVWRGDFELVNIELHRRYGALIRVAPGEYSVDDVEGAKIIYGHSGGFVKVRVLCMMRYCLAVFSMSSVFAFS